MSDFLKTFKEERRTALMSLDESTVRAYLLKWNGDSGHPDPDIFWAGIHKAITGCADLPLDFRKKSKSWLTERKLSSLDDGELE